MRPLFGLAHDEVRAFLAFEIDASDILTEDSKPIELQPADEQHNAHQAWPPGDRIAKHDGAIEHDSDADDREETEKESKI